MSRFFFLIREALINLRRNLLVVAGAVLAVFISLTLAFAALVANEVFRTWIAGWEEGVHVIAFLNDPGINGVPTDAHEQLLAEVEIWEEVKEARYMGKAEAWAEYQEIFAGQDEMLDIDPTVLPASIRIELVDIALHESVAFKLNQQQQVVFRVTTAAASIEQLQNLRDVVKVLGIGAAVVLGLAAVVLIANTIRLAIFARRDEVEIMRLVGASSWYIRIPFLLEGMIEGLLGAGAAVFVVWLAATRLSDAFSGFGLFRFTVAGDFFLRWGLVLLLFGVLAGVLGSMLGLSRHLRESEGVGSEVPTGTLERV
ncbi:MAG TPA: permease-like cell division protein FtsX [Acidimicrobiia bacterium]|nr:permease-like cell division protein FtsX [Acidimicrobiia bacterium]